MQRLITVNDLAERWQKDKTTIRRYVAEGILMPCKGVPGVLFTEIYISSLEGVELNKLSAFERRRLETELEKANKQNAELKNILSKVLAESSKVIEFLEK
ncbi:histidine kinase [Clostridium gasigenes]|uniref:histidine kinase n=1 Tax=Clostridium gasigenes TaxID=94869 RepID=UPI00162591FF|nr:histidine kinase [Clostridium gasigenes]MBB6622175.1 histidine kinase [Clostridium gasigenes]